MLIRKQLPIDDNNERSVYITGPTGEDIMVSSDAVMGQCFADILKYSLSGELIEQYRTSQIIINYINLLTTSYIDAKYRYTPLYDYNDISDELYYVMLKARIKPHIYKIIPIIKKCQFDGLKGLTGSRELSITTNKTGNDTLSKEYGSTINGKNDYSSMHENAPINAELGIINTPNEKQINNNTNESKKTGEDIFTTTYGSNVSDIHNEISPDIYKEYMKVLEKYNIPTLIENIYRKIIYEFNQSL